MDQERQEIMANFLHEAYLHELWEERAAIREYDGEESRQRSEFLAALDIKKIAGSVPDSVLLMVLPDGPVRRMVDFRQIKQ